MLSMTNSSMDICISSSSPLRLATEDSGIEAELSGSTMSDASPDSAMTADTGECRETAAQRSSPLAHLFRLSSGFPFRRDGISPSDANPMMRSSLPGKFFQRFRANSSVNTLNSSTPRYDYSPLNGSDCGSVRRSNSHDAISSLPGN